jgi:hypothetical protein
VLASAFNDAWDRIKTSGSRFARPGYSRATREVIAKRIFEAAQRGVKEPQTLADDAVRFLTANYKDERNNDPALKGTMSEHDRSRKLDDKSATIARDL